MSIFKEYKKLNSFNEFVSKNIENDKNLILKKIKTALSNSINYDSLSIKQKEILAIVKKDLFEDNLGNEIKFKLSKHVIEEIKRLEEKKIPLYLVHRYRYEVYPEKLILDDYPPYLQIEPSSICNYRCVFVLKQIKLLQTKKRDLWEQ